MKRRYVAFLALLAYIFVTGFFQYPTFNSQYWVVGFAFGVLFGMASGVILMWRWIDYLTKTLGLQLRFPGWRGALIDYVPKVLRIAVILIAFGVGFYFILLAIQSSAIFGGSLLIPTLFGVAVLLINLAVGLTRDTPDYSGQFGEMITQLNKIRRQLRRRRR
jgi:hypothetical protein